MGGLDPALPPPPGGALTGGTVCDRLQPSSPAVEALELAPGPKPLSPRSASRPKLDGWELPGAPPLAHPAPGSGAAGLTPAPAPAPART
ncbi:Hypothetical predicted protein [Marmota monax]|uniref:Uncharacterized protein n=1 Tax=Marmota monax TaxID=9995 RepID=A0A5E4BVN8_MARMO|nr:hypothetical protein GHT09_010533 [Marmota monax]VTJ73080.1 Hypothetical predicted protein [Marmota monax]